MRTAERRRVFQVPAERMWTASFFDKTYLSALYHELRIKVQELEIERSGEWPNLVVERKQAIDPDRDIPATLLRAVRGATRIKEHARFDGPNRRFDVSLILPVVGRLIDFKYSYTWDEVGPSTTRIDWTGTCAARVPLLGRKAESFLIGDLVATTITAGDFTSRWFECSSPSSEKSPS